MTDDNGAIDAYSIAVAGQ